MKKLKEGSKVIMKPRFDYFGKLWTVECDSFKDEGNGIETVFLKGFAGRVFTCYLKPIINESR